MNTLENDVINMEELTKEIKKLVSNSTVVELTESYGEHATIYLYEKTPQFFFAIGFGHYATMRVEISDLSWGIDGEEPAGYAINEPIRSANFLAYAIVRDYLQASNN